MEILAPVEVTIMQEMLKSLMSFSWAMSLFGVKQLQNVMASQSSTLPTPRAIEAFQTVTRSTEEQLNDSFREAFRTGDKQQRDVIDRVFGSSAGLQVAGNPQDNMPRPVRPSNSETRLPNPMAGAAKPIVVSQPSTHSGRLDTRALVVLGEGLAAGVGDFTLQEATQRTCFPHQLARHLGIPFTQPFLEPPGLGNVPGFECLPVAAPATFQTTFLRPFPPEAPFSNLAVPCFTVTDALAFKPSAPLVHRDNPKQTAANLILGLPGLLSGDEMPVPTQLQQALGQHPSWVILELGYYDVLEPAVLGDLDLLPEAALFCNRYTQLLTAFRDAKAETLVLTIPDPMHTAHFSTLEAAARCLCVEPGVLEGVFKLPKDSLITVNGLLELAAQIITRRVSPLRRGSTLSAEAAGTVSSRVKALNAGLLALAKEHGAAVYDLHGLFKRVHVQGVAIESRRLTADYLGGFYSLNGYYPGSSGQALIADELVQFVNATYGAAYSPLNVRSVFHEDPVAEYQAPNGTRLTAADVGRTAASESLAPPPPPAVLVEECPRAVAMPSRHGATDGPRSPQTLRLPAQLKQVLPLNKARSFYGDNLRAVHCREDRDSRYGSCGNLLFGGLAMLGSHLSGSVRFQFSPPINHVTRFTMNWGDGLVGDDGMLSAPQFFRLPVRNARVTHWPGTLVSGDLNLETGAVTNFDFRANFSNTALDLLRKVNKNLPQQPIQFPGSYGSAWARFAQRPDGLLDFSFQGTTFLPLGKELQGSPVRWPLPFGARTAHPASIPGAGTALHPFIHLSTCEATEEEDSGACLDIPFNSVREFTLFTHNSSFGDKFSLHSPELGDAQGRSQVLGRVQLQFGERSGDSVPIAVSALPPGGMFLTPADSPLNQQFPGRLPRGLAGHDEFLRFPLRTYFLDTVELMDDPFDLAVGAVDLRTGALHGELLHRGFINQNLFFALVRVEPRTPRSSFFFLGPAVLERDANGQLIYRFNGTVHIPYPEGYRFPAPDLTTAYRAGPNSALDPFLRLQAMHGGRRPPGGMRGGANEVIASNGNSFSYSFKIPDESFKERAVFEYVNHSQGGTFRMSGLAWESFTHSRTCTNKSRPADTVTFTGFGTWSKDPKAELHVCAVQVSTSREAPYVSIQIDGGLVSNVNTKPVNDADTLP